MTRRPGAESIFWRLPEEFLLQWRDFQTFNTNVCLLLPPCCSFLAVAEIFLTVLSSVLVGWTTNRTWVVVRLRPFRASPSRFSLAGRGAAWKHEQHATLRTRMQCVLLLCCHVVMFWSGDPLTPDALISRQPISAPLEAVWRSSNCERSCNSKAFLWFFFFFLTIFHLIS